MLKLFLNIFIVFFLGRSFCFSQSQPVFKKINQSIGLSNGRINSIVKEKNGYVWIGTNNGLNRFDGQTIKVYNKQNSAIGSNDISDIIIDRKNRIWIATLGGGLSYYNPHFDRFTNLKNNPKISKALQFNNVGALLEDSKGFIWLGTEKGLACLDPDKHQLVSFYNLFHDNQSQKSIGITSIYEDKNHNLWIGTFGNGLFIFNPKTKRFKQIMSDQNQFSDFVNVISPLSPDKILVGTRGSGLLLFEVNTLQFSDYLKENLEINQEINIVRSLKVDRKNNLWIGTDGNGLFKVENFDKKPVISNYLHNSPLETSISGNAFFEIMEDDDANIRIGTAWNAVNVTDKKNNGKLLYGDIIGLNPSPVLSIFKKNKILYFGLDGEGMTQFNTQTNQIKYYSSKNTSSSFKANYVQKITETTDGNFWIGTFKNGLIKYKPENEQFIQYKHQFDNKKSISFDDVRDIIEDKNNNLWIATWGGGLNYFNTKTEQFTAYRESATHHKSINNDNLIDLVKDEDNIWIATFGGGLNVLDTKTSVFKYYKHKDDDANTISNNNIFSIF